MRMAFFYMLVNIASFGIAGILFLVRMAGADIYNTALVVGFVSSVFSSCISFSLRDLQDVYVDTASLPAPLPSPKAYNSTIADAWASPAFWRFLFVIFSFTMVRMVFGHLKSTLPKWMTREFGESTPYELYIGLNAALIIVLVPLCTRVSEICQFRTTDALLLGAVISGCSPFWLAFCPPSLLCVIAFITTFSFGEAIWSPRLYEYTVSVPKDGREGIYACFVGAPLYLAKFLAGVSSGYLLQDYCPKQGHCRTHQLWLVIALTTAATPLVLALTRNFIFPKGEDIGTAVGESQHLLKTSSKS